MIYNDIETPYNRREIRDGQAYFEEVNMIQGLYYNRLFDIAVSSFRWEGLPPSIDVRFMETCLLRYGAVIIFYDDVLGYLALPFNYGGGLDQYGEPIKRTAYGKNGYLKTDLDETNSVIIYNNLLRQPSTIGIKFYSQKLATLEDIYNTNLEAQRTPFVVECDESEKESVKAQFRRVRTGERLILGVKDKFKPLTVLKTEAPYLCDSLLDQIHSCWDDALQYFGIASHSYEKREREISAAFEFKGGAIEAARYSRYAARKNGCIAMNELFRFDTTVAFYSEVPRTLVINDVEQANEAKKNDIDNEAITLR